MSTRERTVLVVASGLALAVIAQLLSSIVADALRPAGWFAYAPNTGAMFTDATGEGDGGARWAVAGVWLACIAVWASASIRIYRAPFDGTGRIGKQPDGS